MTNVFYLLSRNTVVSVTFSQCKYTIHGIESIRVLFKKWDWQITNNIINVHHRQPFGNPWSKYKPPLKWHLLIYFFFFFVSHSTLVNSRVGKAVGIRDGCLLRVLFGWYLLTENHWRRDAGKSWKIAPCGRGKFVKVHRRFFVCASRYTGPSTTSHARVVLGRGSNFPRFLCGQGAMFGKSSVAAVENPEENFPPCRLVYA